LQKIGEQMKTHGFNPPRLAEDLTTLGFRLYENLSPADIEERYLKERPNGHLEYVHFVCAVTE
jgi:hypothetical protein